MLEYGKPIGFRNRFPPLLAKRVVVPEASIRALFSTPFNLFPATPGIGFLLERGWMTKDAGTAYTIGGAGNITAVAGALVLFQLSPTNWFDQTTSRTALLTGWGQAANYPTINLESQLAGIAINLQQAAANMTGGTGNLNIYLEFRAFPSGQFIWD